MAFLGRKKRAKMGVRGGVIHQYVNAAIVAGHALDEGRHGLAVAGVGRDRQRLAPGAVNHIGRFVHGRLFSTRQSHLRAGRGIRFSYRQTDPA